MVVTADGLIPVFLRAQNAIALFEGAHHNVDTWLPSLNSSIQEPRALSLEGEFLDQHIHDEDARSLVTWCVFSFTSPVASSKYIVSSWAYRFSLCVGVALVARTGCRSPTAA